MRPAPRSNTLTPTLTLLANLFLHYGFDLWMAREYPGCRFERFADDAVIHCVTERQAFEVRDAVAACRKRCWEKSWVVDLDVKAFFDSVSWNLMLKAVERHTDQKWVLLYVERFVNMNVEAER